MTVKVTFRIGQVGDGTMVDNFDMELSEFVNKAPELGIHLDDITRIEVV